MFNLREFIKIGFLKAIGKMADYQIILNASGYYERPFKNPYGNRGTVFNRS